MQTLRILARGDTLALDYGHANVTGQRRYLGRRTVLAWDDKDLPAGEPCHLHHSANEFLTPEEKAIPHCAYPKTGEPQIVVADAYHIRLVKKGDVWPADEATAKFCGVKFDPNFGGDYPSLAVPTKKSSGSAKGGE